MLLAFLLPHYSKNRVLLQICIAKQQIKFLKKKFVSCGVNILDSTLLQEQQ